MRDGCAGLFNKASRRTNGGSGGVSEWTVRSGECGVSSVFAYPGFVAVPDNPDRAKDCLSVAVI